MPCRLAALTLAAALAVAAPAARADTFADDFERDTTGDIARYVRRDGMWSPLARRPDWKVAGGVLRLDAHGTANDRLNVMAQAGERFSLSVRMRFAGERDFAGGVYFCDDYRFFDNLWFGLRKEGGRSGIETLGGPDLDSWKDAPIEAGRWYTVEIKRDGGRFEVAVDGEPVLERTVAPRKRPSPPAYQDDPLAHGGFALSSRHVSGEYAVEWDDLRIEYEPARDPKMAKQRKIHLPSGPAELTVYHYRDGAEWADMLLRDAPPWLVVMEQLMGTGPCTRTLGYNQQRGTYYDTQHGFNIWGVVQENTAMRKAGGHEECHDWLHLYGQGWTREGSADFYPYLYFDKIDLWRLRSQRLADRPEMLATPNRNFDFLIEDDAGTPLASGEVPLRMVYGGLKCRMFWYILWRTVGLDGLQKLHRRAAREGIELKTADMKRILDEIAGRDLSDVFAGWVTPGKPKYDIFDTIRDGDGDGLSDLDEALCGTDNARPDTDGDGLTDGFEVVHGLAPRDPSDAARWTEPVAIDGRAGEWSAVLPVLRDATGDSGAAPDLRGLRVRPSPKGDIIYAWIEMPRPAGDCWVRVDIDPGATGRETHRMILTPAKDWADLYAAPAEGSSDWRTVPLGGPVDHFVASGPDGIELAIPLAPLGNPDRVTLEVRSGLGKDADALDSPLTTRLRPPAAPEPVTLDGRTGDWADVPALMDDPTGDSPTPVDLRLVKARVSADGKTLWLCATYAGDAPDRCLQLDFDAGADGSFEHRVVVTPRTHAVVLWSHGGPRGDGGIIAATAPGVIELAVPVDRIDRPERIAVSATLHAAGGWDTGPALATIELRKR